MNLYPLARHALIGCGLMVAPAAGAIEARRGDRYPSPHNSVDVGNAHQSDRADDVHVSRLRHDAPRRDNRFPLEECVVGVGVAGAYKAYPFSVLARSVNNRGELLDGVGNQRLRIRYDAAHRSAQAYDEHGRPRPGAPSHWVAWVGIHPRTAVLRAP